MTPQHTTILDVAWIVAPPIDQPARAPGPGPQAPRPTPAVRPWAKPLLTGALGLAALWLAGLAFILIDGALFAETTIRNGYGFAGIPLLCLIAIAFVADPDHESDAEETYVTIDSVPSAQCTPSRNTITGRPE